MKLSIKQLSRGAILLMLPGLAWSGPVNVNVADADTIARELSGIGATRALAIVAYREEHGEFASLDELLRVKGVGPSVLAKNQADILLGDASE